MNYFENCVNKQKTNPLKLEGVAFKLFDGGTIGDSATLVLPNGAHFEIGKSNAEEVIPWVCKEISLIYQAHPSAEKEINDYHGIREFRRLGKRIAQKFPGYSSSKFSNAFWTTCYTS